MSDRSGLQTCEVLSFAEAAPARARDSHNLGQAPASVNGAALANSGLARRIHDNLNWALAFDPRSSPFPNLDLWPEIKALLTKPGDEFVSGLYEILLGRPPDPGAVETLCTALAAGAPRVALVRTIALSDEAVLSQLDVSWLPRLHEIEAEAVWKKLLLLWGKSDRIFVGGLYPLLLVRLPERAGVAAHCRAMRAGASRANVVRAIALSDEAQARGMNVSWLPRLETLPPPPPRPPLISLIWLKKAFRWLRNGVTSESHGSPKEKEGTPQSVGAGAEGGRS